MKFGALLTIAIAWSQVISVAAYAILRAIQHVSFPEPDPATLVWSAHAGFFWRAWTVAFAGGIGGFVVFASARHDGTQARLARALAPGIAMATCLLVLQSVIVP